MSEATERSREALVGASRIVVKVGSSSISGVNRPQIESLVDTIAKLRQRGREVVLVSSGAIATGLPFLNLDSSPDDLPTQQAVAAVGQNILMNRYQRSLDRHELISAQILLTAADIENSKHRRNAHNALERLLGLGVLPIVNENDTVATREIRFGDNDRLASLVARLVNADALVLLSDIDALCTAPPGHPGSTRIEHVASGDPLEGVEFGSSQSGVGTGGAQTKADAARYAAAGGTVAIVTATSLFERAMDGDDVGTLFAASALAHVQ
ncbi:glutamate 5-kinase [Humidisolicoccus flavus]